MAQLLVQVTLPHRKPASNEFSRVNGNYRLTLLAPSHIGLPYGRYPRLALAWVSTEVVRTRSPRLSLGSSLSAFMRSAGLDGPATGGAQGSLTRFALQVRRLFSSTIHCSYASQDGRSMQTAGFSLARKTVLWWTPTIADQLSLFGSYVELSDEFFRSIVEHPVPIDLKVLRALRSPFALDIYMWLTYRMSYLQRPAQISWPLLARQFGAEYRVLRHFRAAFLRHARCILLHYPGARLVATSKSLTLLPSPTHVLPASPQLD